MLRAGQSRKASAMHPHAGGRRISVAFRTPIRTADVKRGRYTDGAGPSGSHATPCITQDLLNGGEE